VNKNEKIRGGIMERYNLIKMLETAGYSKKGVKIMLSRKTKETPPFRFYEKVDVETLRYYLDSLGRKGMIELFEERKQYRNYEAEAKERKLLRKHQRETDKEIWVKINELYNL